jgi:hypothetical protein
MQKKQVTKIFHVKTLLKVDHAHSVLLHNGGSCNACTIKRSITLLCFPKQSMHCKKGLAVFPIPAGMSLIKLFLAGNNFVFPAQREFGQ